jgi:hypothetical protein
MVKAKKKPEVKPKKSGRIKGGKNGRPTKYTPEVLQRTKELIELGLNYQDVCDSLGISYETFCQWRKKFSEFSDTVRVANAKVKEISLKSLRVGEMKDWKAAAWRLERRWPEEYREKKEIEIKEQPILIDDIMGDTNDEEE